MFRKLLELKHWQLFIAMIGGPILIEIIGFSLMANSSNPNDMRYFVFIFPLMMIWIAYFVFGWQWAIITELQDKIPEGVTFNFKRIKAFLIIPVIYLLGISFIVPAMVFAQPNDPMPILGTLPIIVLLHFFSLFCIFHTMVFAGKILKTVEERREVSFSDYAGEFFLIWFSFIGVWILQPRLNKIVQGDYGNKDDVLDDVLIDK